MINHKRPKQSLWSFDDDQDAFKIEAFGDCCLKNTELFDSYGKKCNSRFLLNYGFIEDDNDANQYEFSFQFDSTVVLHDQKVKIFPRLINYSTLFKISRDFGSIRFFQFMNFLRFINISNASDFKIFEVKQNFPLKKFSLENFGEQCGQNRYNF
jgi:histone-lysine N-methyltransferase SETD3